MYVYLKSQPGLWTVGYYTPKGQWVPQSDHNSEISARAEVAFLNGESSDPELTAEVSRLKTQVERLRSLIGAKLTLFDSEIDDLIAEQVEQ